MSIEQKRACAACGKEITDQPHRRGRSRIYCNAECRGAMYGRGMAAEVAVCQNCGREFTRRGKSVRICCGESCSARLIRRETAERMRLAEPGELREWVLELCRKGYGSKAVAAALSLNQGTVKSWLERGKGKKETRKSRSFFSYQEARSAAEWIDALRRTVNMPDDSSELIFENRRIFIVCGAVNVKKGADQLSAIVAGRLRMNPFYGSVYAFCNGECENIRYMFWDGSEFCVVARRREYGKHPWPSSQTGNAIEVSPRNFACILRGVRVNRDNPPLNWDCVRSAVDA